MSGGFEKDDAELLINPNGPNTQSYIPVSIPITKTDGEALRTGSKDNRDLISGTCLYLP